MGLNSRQGGGGALDPDARLYITEVEAALGTPIATALPSATSNPKRILSDFIKAEKAAGMWSMHKRIYLPIYNNSSASAVDMVSLTRGTFFGGITHAAGYVQGDGTSGYFDTLINWNTFATVDNATIGTINLIGPSLTQRTSIGVGSTNATSISVASENSTITPQCAWAGAGVSIALAGTDGVQLASRFNNVTRLIRRSASGIIENTNSAALTGSVINSPITLMARRTASGANFSQYSNAQIGGGIISLGMTSTQLADYSLNLKNLYESLTGLSLPT